MYVQQTLKLKSSLQDQYIQYTDLKWFNWRTEEAAENT